MSYIKFIIKNILEDGTTATNASTPASLGVDNLVNEDKSYILKTTAAGEFYITYTYTTPQFMNAFSLAQYNFDSTATVRVRVWTTSDTGLTPDYDSGNVSLVETKVWGVDWVWGIDDIHTPGDADTEDDIFLLTFDSVYCTVLRIDVIDNSNPESSTEIGRAFAGLSFTPDYNHSYGITFADVYDSMQYRTQDGLWSDEGNSHREMSFTLEWLSDVEHITLRNQLKHAGRYKDILCVAYPDANESKKNQYAIIGKIAQNPTFRHNFYNNYVTSYTIQEN